MMSDQKNKQYWKDIAVTYNNLVGEQGHIRHEQITNPVVFEFLGELQGKEILDAGCGNGYLSRRMAISAKKVTGIDLTEELIEIARNRDNPTNIEFINGDLGELPFTDESFDVILSNLVLMDVEEMELAVKEMSRVLKKEGVLVICLTHPCFENPPKTFAYLDDQGNKIGRVVQDYFDTGLVVDPQKQEAVNAFYQHYHRTLAQYLNAFADAALRVVKTSEPDYNRFNNDPRNDAPTFIIFKLKKSF